MKYIITVIFKNSPRLYKYKTDLENIKINDSLVVENSRGVTIGFVKSVVETTENDNLEEIREVIRVANQEDLDFYESSIKQEKEAHLFCLERIKAREMKMKVVKVVYMLHTTKIIFYFTAEGRVDFRALVKDLAAKFHSRIEMRQIGVRDEAQMLGGIGICGRETCCYTFMGEFQTVSLEDARENSSGVSNEKLIGICGRFMCCLKFEEGSIVLPPVIEEKGEDEVSLLNLVKVITGEAEEEEPTIENQTPQKKNQKQDSIQEQQKPVHEKKFYTPKHLRQNENNTNKDTENKDNIKE